MSWLCMVLMMLPTSPHIPKHSHLLQGWHLQLHFSMASIAWGLVDSCPHPLLSHNPSSYVHSASSYKNSCNYTHMNSFLSFQLLWWHSSTKCSHSSKYISPRRLFYWSSNSPWYAKFGFNKFRQCHEFPFLLSWPATIGKKLWDITLINNVMKTNLWKTFTKTYLSSLGCRSFQKLFHTNAPRHSRAFAPKFCTKQQTSLPNPETWHVTEGQVLGAPARTYLCWAASGWATHLWCVTQIMSGRQHYKKPFAIQVKTLQ